MSDTTTGTRPPTAIEVLRTDLARMESQFQAALPAHIPVERFMRVVMTALQNNPELLKCTRQSLFNACVRAAQDGLLPDGREGAIVPFDSESGSSVTASWLPMVAGLRKKVRNSGEISDWHCEVVHAGDEFDYQKGDNPFIFHRPAPTGGRTRPVTHAYSIAVFKDGTKSREVMTIDEIEDIRKKFSKSRKGPWNNPILYPEMCRKTVARLHSKQLPMSTDLDTLLRRDDELYEFGEARERGKEAVAARPPVANALDYFAGGGAAPPAGTSGGDAPDASKPAGAPEAPAPPDTPDPPQAAPPAPEGPAVPPAAAPPAPPPAQAAPAPAATSGASPSVPRTPEQYRELFDATVTHAKESGHVDQLFPWFNGEPQRRLRNACGLVGEQTDELRAILQGVVAAAAPR